MVLIKRWLRGLGWKNPALQDLNVCCRYFKKITAVTAEADKLLAALPATEPKLAGAITMLNELKGLEEKFLQVEQSLTGKGAILTDERNTAFNAITKKSTQLQQITPDVIHKPSNEQVQDVLGIYKYLNDNLETKYYVIRAQFKNYNSRLKILQKNRPGFIGEVIKFDKVPNAIHFSNKIKEDLRYNLNIKGNIFTLVDMDECDFILRISEIFDETKDI